MGEPGAGERVAGVRRAVVQVALEQAVVQVAVDQAAGGGPVLLRLAGLPASLWAAGACPRLFTALADADAAAAACREHGRTLAARLGDRVVPHPGVTDRERQAVLRVRRAAHNGRPLPDDTTIALARTAAARVDPPSAIGLDRLVARARHHRQAEDRVREDLAAEQHRLAGLPWRLLRSSPVGGAALAHDAADLVADVERRLAAGEPWDGKRLRQRADHLWRLIARGTAKTTPRSWFAHIALVGGTDLPTAVAPTAVAPATVAPATVAPATVAPVAPPGAARPTPTAGPFATHEVPNVHTTRHDPAATTLAPTGLHWSHDGDFVTWAPHPDAPTLLREIRVRDTPALRAVRTALATGPRPHHDLVTTLLGPRADDPAARAALTAFTDHLATLGVLQRCHRVPERTSAWGPPRPRPRTGEDFLDVHRHVTGTPPAPDPTAVRTAVDVLRRLDALIRADTPPPPTTVHDLLDGRPTPLPDLVRRFLAERPDHRPAATDRDTWPVPHDPASGYAELLRRIGHTTEITHDLLDDVGAPRPTTDWPVDCLLRPLPGDPGAVLEAVVPAGVLDARFARGLELLHGNEPAAVTAHREFLRGFEHRRGGRLVEVLVPPHNARSANAVRRPAYTDLWTGDPDAHPYLGRDHPGRYVPLHEITLRRDGRHVVAEARGERLWPVHHATRAPFPPWDLALALLLAAGPRTPDRHRPQPIAAFPDRRHLPRLTAGPVVLTRAQWRVDRDELWAPDADVETRFRALGRLTRARALPRWVFAGAPGDRQVPVDLAGLPALRTLDRLLTADSLVLTEMLPDPTGSPVEDTAGDRLACQLLLRLPVADATDPPPVRVGAAPAADAT
ncbi:lantibiotic dehydratase [Saccharothrix syringae]|uniref:Lantibiotic dehydratase n=1 Tax=Saccharothrix syringae TaxID=103733 RepID=A0A5Q0H260_SACSY|nr:lantibiotic dehydratase [Saccharothrix syringae]QFZ20219.1 lantibiotic dehydratase [Saccharothrix syringae]